MDFQTYLEVSPYRPFPWDARVVSLDFQVAVTPAFGGHGGPSDDYIIQDDFVPLADLEAPVDEGPTGVEPQATTADPGHVEKLERPKPKSYAKALQSQPLVQRPTHAARGRTSTKVERTCRVVVTQKAAASYHQNAKDEKASRPGPPMRRRERARNGERSRPERETRSRRRNPREEETKPTPLVPSPIRPPHQSQDVRRWEALKRPNPKPTKSREPKAKDMKAQKVAEPSTTSITDMIPDPQVDWADLI